MVLPRAAHHRQGLSMECGRVACLTSNVPSDLLLLLSPARLKPRPSRTHPHYTPRQQLVGYSEDSVCILLKYYELGSLEDFIHEQHAATTTDTTAASAAASTTDREPPKYDYATVVQLVSQVAEGLAAIHAAFMAHQDIKVW